MNTHSSLSYTMTKYINLIKWHVRLYMSWVFDFLAFCPLLLLLVCQPTQAKSLLAEGVWILRFCLLFTMDYHLVSVPASGNRQNTFQSLKGKLAELANTYSFTIPEFKVSMKARNREPPKPPMHVLTAIIRLDWYSWRPCSSIRWVSEIWHYFWAICKQDCRPYAYPVEGSAKRNG